MTEDATERAGNLEGASAAEAGIAPGGLQERLREGEPIRLLDVRDREEFEQWHISGPTVTPTQIPHAKFMAAQVNDDVGALAAEIDGEGTVIVVCGRGEASDYVAELLREAGTDARNLEGGMAAWARVYEARAIEGSEPTVIQYGRPASGCLAYMVVSAGEAAVIDPLQAFTDRYVADARERGAEIVAVLDTHVHADHVSGLRSLADATGARRLVPAGALDRGLTFDCERVTDRDLIGVGDGEIEAVALPGHTTEMTGYRVGSVLLGGDSIFLEGVARPDLQADRDPAALARELHATLTDRLDRLGDAVVLAPGHYEPDTRRAGDGTYTGSLSRARERANAGEEGAFVERTTSNPPPEPRSARRIVAINLGRESVEDDALELELGPNNCAI